ncbi:MAG TPA: outer membrane protein assembly factor BamE [Gemmataceae bacterium]|nr:outer membrane protein assembly factor BamE [Gemmataceae bacterium]
MLHRRTRLIRAAIGCLTLVLCTPFLAVAIWLAAVVLTTGPGIGDVEVAQSKIKPGMSKHEVRSVLGAPHVDRGNEWDYWDTRFAGSILRVRFGDDGQLTSSEWWLD